jgi:hypothetical protein
VLGRKAKEGEIRSLGERLEVFFVVATDLFCFVSLR